MKSLRDHRKGGTRLLKEMRGDGWVLEFDKYFGLYSDGKFYPNYKVTRDLITLTPLNCAKRSDGFEASIWYRDNRGRGSETTQITFSALAPNAAVNGLVALLNKRLDRYRRIVSRVNREMAR